jgi:chorismate mutase
MQFASFYTSSKSEELIRKLDAEILALMEKRTKLQKPATRAHSET